VAGHLSASGLDGSRRMRSVPTSAELDTAPGRSAVRRGRGQAWWAVVPRRPPRVGPGRGGRPVPWMVRGKNYCCR
jgi:hypothetical protein